MRIFPDWLGDFSFCLVPPRPQDSSMFSYWVDEGNFGLSRFINEDKSYDQEVKSPAQENKYVLYVLDQHESILAYCVLYKQKCTLTASQSGCMIPSNPGA